MRHENKKKKKSNKISRKKKWKKNEVINNKINWTTQICIKRHVVVLVVTRQTYSLSFLLSFSLSLPHSFYLSFSLFFYLSLSLLVIFSYERSSLMFTSQRINISMASLESLRPFAECSIYNRSSVRACCVHRLLVNHMSSIAESYRSNC